MAPDDQVRENLIRILEAQPLLHDRYSLIQRLTPTAGNGHFSLMFRAHDTQTRRDVALKVFNPTMAADTYRLQCFERESRILERVNGSPNLLVLISPRTSFQHTLRDAATGIPIPFEFQYFAVPLAKCSLKDYTHSAEWTASKALCLFRETCKGVQRLHTMGICHRDLKPDNLLIFGALELRVSDFGTAKYLGEREPALRPSYSAPVGDRRYASPELLARVEFSDAFLCAGDMFALGAILFELFTGTILTLELYNSDLRQFIAYVAQVPERNRREVFDDIIGDLANQIELPEIDSFTDRVPRSIRPILSRLYRRLAAIDYRRRDRNFVGVFGDLNICIVLASNEDKYQRWLARRRRKGQQGSEVKL